jgi:hypothetical protein
LGYKNFKLCGQDAWSGEKDCNSEGFDQVFHKVPLVGETVLTEIVENRKLLDLNLLN